MIENVKQDIVKQTQQIKHHIYNFVSCILCAYHKYKLMSVNEVKQILAMIKEFVVCLDSGLSNVSETFLLLLLLCFQAQGSSRILLFICYLCGAD